MPNAYYVLGMSRGAFFMRTFEEPLSPEEEKHYLKLMQEGDKGARDILIERNLRLVAHVIKKYAHEEREMEDLLSIGTIGLIKAINTFRPEKGNKLATYAAKCIDKATPSIRLQRAKRTKIRPLYWQLESMEANKR